MTTRMNTTINNSKKNVFGTTFVVEGLSGLSHKSFVEFHKLRTAYWNNEDISNNWKYPPCFLIALREHFLAVGQQYDAECVESVILSMDWLFDGVSYQTFYRNSENHMEIVVKQYNGNEELPDKVFNTSNKQNLEVLRDLCLPMVYNW
jgi:hypothetical protein